MSTDRQDHSIDHQTAAIAEYARERGLRIEATYADEACSGLTADRRPSLQQMIVDITSGALDVSEILVFDVSRWGRFQDADEGAYYEFICRSAGVNVHYCAETFTNDGGLSSTLMKAIKRIMAGEYSRELSRKVFLGHCRLASQGYRQGGPCTLGHQRVLVAADGGEKIMLNRGDRKVLQSERVVLRLGPIAQQLLVQRIFGMFADNEMNETDISRFLNTEGELTANANRWNRGSVHRVLTNRLYIGESIYNRTSQTLKTPRRKNPEGAWVRNRLAVAPIIDRDLFQRVQSRIEARPRPYGEAALLVYLRRLLAEHGQLTAEIIDAAAGGPNSTTIARHFGNLHAAYAQVGFRAVRGPRARPPA